MLHETRHRHEWCQEELDETNDLRQLVEREKGFLGKGLLRGSN